MDWMFTAILLGAGLIALSILTSVVAFRFGAPLLLVFLCIGLIAGEDGLGLVFNDAEAAYFVGSLALAVILFDSGFGTRSHTLKRAAAPAFVLATVGVLLTTVFVGVAARFLFELPWLYALLMGAIISSTDAAAVFFYYLLHHRQAQAGAGGFVGDIRLKGVMQYVFTEGFAVVGHRQHDILLVRAGFDVNMW